MYPRSTSRAIGARPALAARLKHRGGRSPFLWASSRPRSWLLRAKAREAVRSGKLPSRRPDRTWGGPEVGATCTVCGEAITKDQLEFKVQFAHDGSNPGLDKFHIHVRCFAAWVLERPDGGPAHSSAVRSYY